MREKVGFTTTIPVEILFAGGYEPCDLNNIFITDENPRQFIERAERDGFPKSMCNWIKGIYGVVMEKGINTVITVMEGDCSNTLALAEILGFRGIRTVPFLFPYDRNRTSLKREIKKLMKAFSVDEERLATVEEGIRDVRANLRTIDRMTWETNVVTGYENHLWLVRASDMLGDYGIYGNMAREFIREAEQRKSSANVRIGYMGVPPIFLDLHEFIEGLDARVVYNETQRQFSIPSYEKKIVERYLDYTYPYGIFARLDDILEQVKMRKIDGIIHYVQAFCFRAIEDVILREKLGVPVVTVEGDMPKPLDARTRLRIEAFVEMLQARVHGVSASLREGNS